MHNSSYDELFFASKIVAGLKDEIRATVEPHVLVTVNRAALIAKIQQRTLERQKSKATRNNNTFKPQFQRADNNTALANPNL